jgi:hypothetical protein
MSTKYIRDAFYVLLAAQFVHVGVMVQLKRVLGPQPEPAQLGSLGLWGQVLTWGWVLLFLVAFISHVRRGPLRAKEAAFGLALALVIPVFWHFSM